MALRAPREDRRLADSTLLLSLTAVPPDFKGTWKRWGESLTLGPATGERADHSGKPVSPMEQEHLSRASCLTECGGRGVRTPPRPGWESQAVPWEGRKAWAQWARKSLDAGLVLPSPKRETHP